MGSGKENDVFQMHVVGKVGSEEENAVAELFLFFIYLMLLIIYIYIYIYIKENAVAKLFLMSCT